MIEKLTLLPVLMLALYGLAIYAFWKLKDKPLEIKSKKKEKTWADLKLELDLEDLKKDGLNACICEETKTIIVRSADDK